MTVGYLPIFFFCKVKPQLQKEAPLLALTLELQANCRLQTSQNTTKIFLFTFLSRYHAPGHHVAVRAKLLRDAEVTLEYENLPQKFKVTFSPITLTRAILFWRS